jgi:hypothetical protein
MRLGGSERLDRVTMQTTIAKTIANAKHDGGERTPEEGGIEDDAGTAVQQSSINHSIKRNQATRVSLVGRKYLV